MLYTEQGTFILLLQTMGYFPREVGHSSEDGLEKEVGAAELVAQFKGGTPFFYRRDERDAWKSVDNLAVDTLSSGRSPRVLVRTADMEPRTEAVVSAEILRRMQEEAAEQGAAEFVQKVAEANAASAQVELDLERPSPEGKKRIFALWYESAVAEKVLREEMYGEDAFTPRRFSEVQSDFEAWAGGHRLDEAGHTFANWKREDFVDMLHLFSEAETRLRQKIQAEFLEQGVDTKATRELLKRAKQAEEAMRKSAIRLRNVNGIGEKDRDDR